MRLDRFELALPAVAVTSDSPTALASVNISKGVDISVSGGGVGNSDGEGGITSTHDLAFRTARLVYSVVLRAASGENGSGSGCVASVIVDESGESRSVQALVPDSTLTKLVWLVAAASASTVEPQPQPQPLVDVLRAKLPRLQGSPPGLGSRSQPKSSAAEAGLVTAWLDEEEDEL